jgi:glycosyltransferase involved in cell wall biosynthesis
MSAPIAVGVDAANILRDRRGIGRYARALLRIWRTSYADRIETTLLVPHIFPPLQAPAFAGLLGGSWRIARRQDARRLDLDLIWYPWNGMEWTTDIPSVVSTHDVWPLAAPAENPVKRKREQQHYFAALPLAKKFIVPSNFTKSEIVRLLGVDPGRVVVIPHGVEPLTATPPRSARIAGADRYVLFVGEAEPRKDVATLVKAMALLPQVLRASTALVVVGRTSAVEGVTGTGVQVEIMGHVSDKRLAALYSGAAAFVFPSRYEGFGLPILEAMQYGTPVIAADAASLPEAGGDAARYFRAGDPAALAAQLTNVLHDRQLALSMSEAGRERAAELSYRACAQATLQIFERVCRS